MSKTTIEIDERIRCRLVWLLRLFHNPLEHGLEPLADAVDEGAWTDTALKQLTEGLPEPTPEQVQSFGSRDEVLRKLEMWARKDDDDEVFTLEWGTFEEREMAGRILVEWEGMLETLTSIANHLEQNGKELRKYSDKLEARARECAGWAVSDLAGCLVLAARTRDVDLAMDKITHKLKEALEKEREGDG